MLKVLYLINHAGKAGTERYVYSLIEKLHNKRIKACLVYNEEGLLVDRLKAIGVDTYRIEMKNRFDIKAAWQLNKLCRKLNIDIVHSQFLRENYITMLSRLLNPHVRAFYTNHFILENNLVTRLSNRLITPLQTQIIAVCNKGRDMMISNGVNGKKITVIFNGVEAEYWRTPIESTVRDEFKIGKDEFLILCASRFAHDKGHRFLVNALTELKKTTDERFRCLLAGDGPLLEEIKNQVKENNLEEHVVFTGFRSDIKNLFYGCDLYVNASEHEALSFLIIEALASGMPTIVTDMGGNRDIVSPGDKCGLLVRYNDHQQLAGAINTVMQSRELREGMRQSALQTAFDKFNLDKMVGDTYKLYVNSAGKGGTCC